MWLCTHKKTQEKKILMIDFINEYFNLILIAVAIYEAFARLIPTFKNYSLLDFIYMCFNALKEIINTYVPNKKK
jgi:hypothetical protein